MNNIYDFNFEIIKANNGEEVIDNKIKTAFKDLTPLQRLDYFAVEMVCFPWKDWEYKQSLRKEETIIDKAKILLRRCFV